MRPVLPSCACLRPESLRPPAFPRKILVCTILSMAAYEFASKEFDDAVRAAGRRAFEETLAAGLSVFYLDDEGLDVMEQPDGRRFEIRWIPGAPSGENFEILREIKKRAA